MSQQKWAQCIQGYNVGAYMLLGDLVFILLTFPWAYLCGFPLGINADLRIISQVSVSISFTSTFLDKTFTQLCGFLCLSKKMKPWNRQFCDLANVLVAAVFGEKRGNCWVLTDAFEPPLKSSLFSQVTMKLMFLLWKPSTAVSNVCFFFLNHSKG